MTDHEYWYRYRDYPTANVLDDFGNPIPGTGHTQVVLDQFLVLKHTRKGVWLEDSTNVNGGPRSGQRFVLFGEGKRFARSTKEEAKRSFIRRKQRQILINRAAIRRAEAAIELVKAHPHRIPNLFVQFDSFELDV